MVVIWLHIEPTGQPTNGERLEYRMPIVNVYREVVQSPQNLTKRSTCTYKDFCKLHFDYESKL